MLIPSHRSLNKTSIVTERSQQKRKHSSKNDHENFQNNKTFLYNKSLLWKSVYSINWFLLIFGSSIPIFRTPLSFNFVCNKYIFFYLLHHKLKHGSGKTCKRTICRMSRISLFLLPQCNFYANCASIFFSGKLS